LYEAGAVRNIAGFIRENWRLELNLKGLKACTWRIGIQAATGSSNNPWQWLCQR
jgi:hypothetical protein